MLLTSYVASAGRYLCKRGNNEGDIQRQRTSKGTKKQAQNGHPDGGEHSMVEIPPFAFAFGACRFLLHQKNLLIVLC